MGMWTLESTVRESRLTNRMESSWGRSTVVGDDKAQPISLLLCAVECVWYCTLMFLCIPLECSLEYQITGKSTVIVAL